MKVEDVRLYDTNDDRSAHIGELSVTSLDARGCRGAVIDGGARDVGYILDTDFPVFARYNTPADAVPRWEILEWGVETVAGGVRVAPGDVVVGDVDGVVVVPEAVREAVLREAEDLVDTESEVRDAVRDGVLPLAAYEEHGEF
jgi:regulator of RNase E activity RraA